MQKKRSLSKMFWEVTKVQIYALIICSIILFSTTFILEYTLGVIFIQALNLFISGGVLYATLWIEGDREKNFVQFGRIEPDMNWGLKVGLVGMILPMLTMVMLIIAKITNLPDMIVYYKLVNPQLNMLINLFVPTLDPQEISILDLLLNALLYLYIPACSAIGYRLGYHRISLSEKLVYVDKNKKNKNGKTKKK